MATENSTEPRTRIVAVYDAYVVADETFTSLRRADDFLHWFWSTAGVAVKGGAVEFRADKPDPFATLERALIPGARRAFGAWCRSQHSTVPQIPVAQSA